MRSVCERIETFDARDARLFATARTTQKRTKASLGRDPAWTTPKPFRLQTSAGASSADIR
jgi:hypothetical protein